MDNVFGCFTFISRPDFYTIYVEEPDSAGHDSGPVSAKVSKNKISPPTKKNPEAK